MKTITIASIEGYFSTLKSAGIILDQEERRQAIERTVAGAAKAFRGAIAPEMIQYGLLEEVAFLTENPQPLIGEFDKKYLELPRDVLLASMAKHQRVFAIESDGKLLPHCIAVLEGRAGKPSEVGRIVERILNARLADAALFLQQDIDRSLDKMAQNLAGLTFHERLGSMAEKTQRVETLTQHLSEVWHLDNQTRELIKQAARLAKADLVSNMVREFPSLQGIMGKFYAGKSAYPDAVAQAIEQQYWLREEIGSEVEKRNAANVPGGDVSIALAIAEKYDTLASYFGIGIEPSGSTDPFGLRRCAIALLELASLLSASRKLSLKELFSVRAKFPPFASMKEQEREKCETRLRTYILERLYTRPLPEPGITQDTIDAVLASGCDDLVEVLQRLEALHQLRGADGGSMLVKAAKVIERTRNILKGAKPADGPVEPSLLKEEPEQLLWQAYTNNKDRVGELINKRSYDKATLAFGEAFYEPLHAFFDKVMVNAPEENLRRNRLALMRTIQTLYTDQVADLSKLNLLQQ